uniref:Uncharacterized protein n=1 Tax=Arthrobacter phage SWEP2 TaxID=2945958 RepID=A0A9E7MJ24_9CAUD
MRIRLAFQTKRVEVDLQIGPVTPPEPARPPAPERAKYPTGFRRNPPAESSAKEAGS